MKYSREITLNRITSEDMEKFWSDREINQMLNMYLIDDEDAFIHALRSRYGKINGYRIRNGQEMANRIPNLSISIIENFIEHYLMHNVFHLCDGIYGLDYSSKCDICNQRQTSYCANYGNYSEWMYKEQIKKDTRSAIIEFPKCWEK